MSALLTILSVVGAIALLVVRSLAVDEVKGRVQRRITAKVEATIDALPEELQAEWADEWRAELATVISMPFTAARFALDVRIGAYQLIASQAPAPAGINNHASAIRRRAQDTTAGWAKGVRRNLLHALGNVTRRCNEAVATSARIPKSNRHHLRRHPPAMSPTWSSATGARSLPACCSAAWSAALSLSPPSASF